MDVPAVDLRTRNRCSDQQLLPGYPPCPVLKGLRCRVRFEARKLLTCSSVPAAELSVAAGWLQETELLAAGFPCVDVSRQGLRKGMAGKVTPQICEEQAASVSAWSLLHIAKPSPAKIHRELGSLACRTSCSSTILFHEMRDW